jgi:hypothetical protein
MGEDSEKENFEEERKEEGTAEQRPSVTMRTIA